MYFYSSCRGIAYLRLMRAGVWTLAVRAGVCTDHVHTAVTVARVRACACVCTASGAALVFCASTPVARCWDAADVLRVCAVRFGAGTVARCRRCFAHAVAILRGVLVV